MAKPWGQFVHVLFMSVINHILTCFEGSNLHRFLFDYTGTGTTECRSTGGS